MGYMEESWDTWRSKICCVYVVYVWTWSKCEDIGIRYLYIRGLQNNAHSLVCVLECDAVELLAKAPGLSITHTHSHTSTHAHHAQNERRRIQCDVEVTEWSTNIQHTLSIVLK
jgi:hypothetical protein